jgi:hypothetical protein
MPNSIIANQQNVVSREKQDLYFIIVSFIHVHIFWVAFWLFGVYDGFTLPPSSATLFHPKYILAYFVGMRSFF